MARFLLKTKNAKFNGSRYGVMFKDGVGETDDQKKANALKSEFGYELIDTKAKEQETQQQNKTVEDEKKKQN